MAYAERNRLIKKVLTTAFGAGRISVRGGRGTASGWVTVDIAYAPKDRDERDTLKAKVWELFAAAKIEIGTYGYDDPGSDYGFGKEIHLNFEACRDTFQVGERVHVAYCSKPGVVAGRDYAKGGDWYIVALDDGTIEKGCYKNDLVRV